VAQNTAATKLAARPIRPITFLTALARIRHVGIRSFTDEATYGDQELVIIDEPSWRRSGNGLVKGARRACQGREAPSGARAALVCSA
jgi:hypothetical protein